MNRRIFLQVLTATLTAVVVFPFTELQAVQAGAIEGLVFDGVGAHFNEGKNGRWLFYLTTQTYPFYLPFVSRR